MVDACVLIQRDVVWGFYANVGTELAKLVLGCVGKKNAWVNPTGAGRIREEGCDTVVFFERDGQRLLKRLFSPSWRVALVAGEEEKQPYAGAVARLPELGDPGCRVTEEAPDFYRKLGISEGDIPALFRMLQDGELRWLDGASEEVPMAWARIHAQRALFELRAPGLAKVLLNERRDSGEEAMFDIISIDSGWILPQLGEEAYAALKAELVEHGDERSYRIDMVEFMSDIAADSCPQFRDECVMLVMRFLEEYPANERHENGFLVSDLIKLRAVEAAGLVEKVYGEGAVDMSVCGDLDEVQVKLGLKARRETPESEMRAAIRREHEQQYPEMMSLMESTRERVGRNDPCPCGSGKKYKKCCMDK